MKPSHATTPRSLRECNFTTGYTTQPVGRRDTGYGTVWWAIVTLCAIAGFVLVVTTGPAA